LAPQGTTCFLIVESITLRWKSVGYNCLTFSIQVSTNLPTLNSGWNISPFLTTWGPRGWYCPFEGFKCCRWLFLHFMCYVLGSRPPFGVFVLSMDKCQSYPPPLRQSFESHGDGISLRLLNCM